MPTHPLLQVQMVKKFPYTMVQTLLITYMNENPSSFALSCSVCASDILRQDPSTCFCLSPLFCQYSLKHLQYPRRHILLLLAPNRVLNYIDDSRSGSSTPDLPKLRMHLKNRRLLLSLVYLRFLILVTPQREYFLLHLRQLLK